ncbi:MAG: DUF1989 domain-containing protein [Candidatus Dormibacteria bacterium]
MVIGAGKAAALTAQRGQVLEIIDVEGQQVADFVAFRDSSLREWLSTTHTRSATMRLDVRVGDVLQSNWRAPMFEVLHDDVGSHDVITSMCDDRRYELDYGVSGHRSCRSNLCEVLAPWEVAEERIPDPFNFFQNAPILGDRSFGNQLPLSKPGDRLVLRLLLDAIIGVSACPQDLNPCNGFRPSPIQLRLRPGTTEEN